MWEGNGMLDWIGLETGGIAVPPPPLSGFNLDLLVRIQSYLPPTDTRARLLPQAINCQGQGADGLLLASTNWLSGHAFPPVYTLFRPGFRLEPRPDGGM